MNARRFLSLVLICNLLIVAAETTILTQHARESGHTLETADNSPDGLSGYILPFKSGQTEFHAAVLFLPQNASDAAASLAMTTTSPDLSGLFSLLPSAMVYTQTTSSLL